MRFSSGFLKIQNQGPMLADPRIYLRIFSFPARLMEDSSEEDRCRSGPPRGRFIDEGSQIFQHPSTKDSSLNQNSNPYVI